MTSDAPMTITQFAVDSGQGDIVMKAAMKRYVPKGTTRYAGDTGYILIFTHGAGFMKELWEPVIERLFTKDRSNHGHSKILESWAIDCQTHGASAPLNDDILARHPGVLNVYFYSDTIVKLYKSGFLGVINNKDQKIVLIGHSAGSLASVLATSAFGDPTEHPFHMLILVEPPLLSSETKHKMTPMFKIVEKTNRKRRAVWNSKEDAQKFFESTLPYNVWDPRMRSLFIEHGLRPLPTPFITDKKGVTLICKPSDEAAGFENVHHSTEALEHLSKICTATPVHFVFGARNDMFSREVQDVMHDHKAGRTAASVIRIEGTGHLVLQDKPDALADIIFTTLNSSPQASKL